MIGRPLKYSEAARDVVSIFDALPAVSKNGAFWDREDVAVVRKEAKQHYIREQSYRCCYCDRSLHSQHGRVWDVEHIVPRSTHPQFLFDPQNLSISCIECNSEKSNANVLRNEKRVKYPRKSEDFIICHPHFDRLSDHVLILLERFYFPISKKGRKTIEICGLLRYAYEYIEWDSGIADNDRVNSVFQKIMNAKDENEKTIGIMELIIVSGMRIVR